MPAQGLVHILKLTLAGYALGQDLRTHAAQQVKPDGTARMPRRLDSGVRLDPDVDQLRLAEQFG
jgi:hypothetical protein